MSQPLSRGARYAVLGAAFGALLFDGLELGLMPLVSRSVSKALLGASYTATRGGDGCARGTAAQGVAIAVKRVLADIEVPRLQSRPLDDVNT